jgi:ElaB/YqjD/DUF883 family membrane-anchored ribosome-binding protein
MPVSTHINQAADKADKTILETEKRLEVLVDRAESAVQEALELVRTRGRVYADNAGQQLDEAQRILTERVQERPLTSTFAALGVGVIVGFLVSGRR